MSNATKKYPEYVDVYKAPTKTNKWYTWEALVQCWNYGCIPELNQLSDNKNITERSSSGSQERFIEWRWTIRIQMH